MPRHHAPGDRHTARFPPARLEGYRRGPLTGVDYPAISPCRGSLVEGLLYLDLPPAAWPRLDSYEGETYRRSPVRVVLVDGSIKPAETYVLRPEYLDRLGESAWSYEAFLAGAEAGFEKDCENFPAGPGR